MSWYSDWMKSRGACGLGPLSSSRDDPFNQMCEEHDEDYIDHKLHGGEELRKEDDSEFRQEMLDNSEGKLDRVKAKLYYWIARSVGWIPWYLNKRNGK